MPSQSRLTRVAVSVLAGAMVAGLAWPTPEARGEVTAAQVKIAINKAIRHIKSTQKGDGSWQDYGRRNGATALNTLALLAAGVPESDPGIRKAISNLDKTANRDTYVVALKAMVYRYAGPKKYRKQLQEAGKWLIDAQLPSGTWGYNKMTGARGRVRGYIGDNSNTQFALLGLHEAANGGVRVPKEVWKRSEDHFVKTQLHDGGWHYRFSSNRRMSGYGSMTCAGIASLYITGNQLEVGRPINDPGDFDTKPCVTYRQHDVIAKGLLWLARHFAVDTNPGRGATAWRMYYLYAMERVGMISGLKFFGSRDWYRQGAEALVDIQRGDGSFPNAAYDTAFCLLFLAKGNKPALVNKLKWGRGTEWCPVRNDIDHLVKFLNDAESDNGEKFTDQPLGWQVVDLRAPLADLLDAPILYLTGYRFPSFSVAERNKLAEFVEQGGTIVAASCCSQRPFAEGFRRFARDTWPEYPLDKLPDDHPIFGSFYNLKKNEWGLEGIQVGCRTSIIFAPKDLNCHWERQAMKLADTQAAFRIGANICAYATGLERLKDKLERARVAEHDGPGRPRDIVRGALHIAVLAHSKNPMENMTNPKALAKFHEFLRDHARIDVVSKLKVIEPTDPELLNHPIMFMTGHLGFDYTDAQLKAIRTWLDRGGFLYANACCGRDKVNYNLPGDRELINDLGTSFRKMCRQLYPEHALAELPADHPIRGSAKGFFPLAQVTYRPMLQKKLLAANANTAHELHLEGVTVDGRLVIVYSRYSITCGLNEHKCFGCRGLISKDAYRVSTNVILYALSH